VQCTARSVGTSKALTTRMKMNALDAHSSLEPSHQSLLGILLLGTRFSHHIHRPGKSKQRIVHMNMNLKGLLHSGGERHLFPSGLS
jgi:hypothetical protein